MPKTYRKKFKNLDLTPYSPLDIYKLVLSGTISRFPKDFFTCEEADTYVPIITRYLIEDILKWSKEDIKKNLRKNTFYENKLAGLIAIRYNSSPYKAIIEAYGEDYIKPWELINAPNDYWQGEEGIKNGYFATKWLIEEKLKWNDEDIKSKLNHNVFVENNLLGMIKRCYEGSIYKCINSVYPNRFMPWEVGYHVSNNYWNKEKATQSVKWLIEKKLKWNIEDIKNNLSKQTFIDYGLYGMIQKYFNGSPFQAINEVYPNKIKPWELKASPNHYWNEENSKLAVNWLIFEKLKLSKEYAKSNLTKDLLKKHGFYVITEKYSLKEIIDFIN